MTVRRAGSAACLLAVALAWSPQARAQRVAPEGAAQLAALRAEKAARTPAQGKLSSQLLYERRMRRGEQAAPGIPVLRTRVEVFADGSVLVDLRAEPTARLLAEIAGLGGQVVESHPEYGAVRARIPLESVEELAALPEVRSIRPADRAVTRKIDTSEGDVAHRAVDARSVFGIDGTGVTVGVLSDGVDSLASLEASGDLPAAVTVLPGQAGSGDEGTAMLEIVHDLAPGAALMFATAFGSEAGFASNVQALRAAGADVIVDDVIYFAEPVFQDGDVAAAVDEVTADGALYFSAAGNEGNLDDGTAGVWEGDFVASGTTIAGHPVHDFGGGDVTNKVTVDAPILFTLQWADPQGGSSNDYDLYLLNANGTRVVAASTDVQNGDDDPFEAIDSTQFNDATNQIVIARAAGAARFLHLNANGGRFEHVTAGQTWGHPAARAAFAVAAVRALGRTTPFTGTESVETYSSDGPRRVFYEADGTPITPGNFSHTGGELRAKPDLAAADCVDTATPGFSPFCGTSAAAPHAGAIAALLLEEGAGHGITLARIREALETTALDIEAAGFDRDAGAGIADALGAAEELARECDDGLDNDGDGLVDLDDPGCADADDLSEQSPLLPCDDGVDDDGDGLTDYRVAPGAGDPGCASPVAAREDPKCQNGLDDDGDGFRDWDGGASAGVAPADQTAPDPQCQGHPDRNRESPSACGLGAELAAALGVLLASRRSSTRVA